MKLTKEKYDELLTELKRRETTLRAQIKEDIIYAQEQGDFYRENHPFQEATEKLQENEDRIKEIKHILNHYQIIDSKEQRERITIGSFVRISTEGEVKEFTIVDPIEANSLMKKISSDSPLGRILIGKQVNEEVVFEHNEVRKVYRIMEII